MSIDERLYNDINTSKAGLSAKVDKETGKGLSENDFTDAYKDALDDLNAPTSRVTTVTTTELTTDNLIVCNSASDISVNLLAATGSNRLRQVANINTGKVTITPNGADTIQGEAYQEMYIGAITLKDYENTKWVIL